MAIGPSSDIVMDVLQAADPKTASATVRRLEAASSGPSAFESVANAVTAAQTQRSVGGGGATSRSGMGSANRGSPSGAIGKVGVEFEALLLSSFITQIMPEETTSSFGSGEGGRIWKSVMAEKIAFEMARSGRLGIAKRLLANTQLALGPSTRD